jgi:hypothetical protein
MSDGRTIEYCPVEKEFVIHPEIFLGWSTVADPRLDRAPVSRLFSIDP